METGYPCLFCCKIVTDTLESAKFEEGRKFVKLLGKFIGQSIMVGEFGADGYLKLISQCADCNGLARVFCNQFERWERLRMEVEWTLKQVVEILRLASRVPSRKEELAQFFSENGCAELTSFRRLRKFIQAKCISKLSNSAPRVKLKRMTTSNGAELSEGIFRNMKQESPTTNSFPVSHFLLGWAFTYAAVTLLASEYPSEVVPEAFQTSVANDLQLVTLNEQHLIDQFDDGDFDNDANQASPVSVAAMENGHHSFPDNPEIANVDLVHSGVIAEQERERSREDLEIGVSEKVKLEADTVPVKTEPTARYACQFCEATYKTKRTIQEHIRAKHRKEKENSKKTAKPFSCKMCQKSFTKYDSLRLHKLQSQMHRLTKILLGKKKKHRSESSNLAGDSTKEPSLEVNVQIETPSASLLANFTDCSSSTGVLVKTPNDSVAISTTAEPQHRYSLRGNRKRRYAKSEDEEEIEKVDLDYKDEEDSLSSSSNDSAAEEDEQGDVKPNIKNQMEGGVHKLLRVHCRRDGCRFLKKNKISVQKAEEHTKLHKPGRFKCHFCEQVENSIFRLSSHERTQHSKKTRKEGHLQIHYCSRCPYESSFHISLHNHFAEVHIGGFDSRRGKKNWVKCEICQLHVLNLQVTKEKHSREYHCTTDEDTISIKCSVVNCSAYFLKEAQREEHERIVHGILSPKAPVSQEDIEQQRQTLRENVEVDTETETSERFICKWCGKKFASVTTCILHQNSFHVSNQTKNSKGHFLCPVVKCPETFVTVHDLKVHQTLHGKFICNVCKAELDFAPDLAIHEMQHGIKVGKKPKLTKSIKRRHSGQLNCSRCPGNYTKKSSLVSHFLTEHLQLPTGFAKSRVCNICNASATKQSLKNHKRAYHRITNVPPEEVRRCDLCPAYFVNCKQLIAHKVKVHWENKCPGCEATFKEWQNPHALMRLHLEQYHPQRLPHLKFPCTKCPCFRRFATQQELNKHLAEENCEIPDGQAICQECGRDCKTKMHLVQHISNVHGKRSFVCEQCGKGFKSKISLTKHQEYHKNPNDWKYECKECKKKCASKQSLEQHQRTHTKEKPYVCQYCGKRIAHQHNWKNHLRTQHPEQEDKDALVNPIRQKGYHMQRKGSKKNECITAGSSSMNCKEINL